MRILDQKCTLRQGFVDENEISYTLYSYSSQDFMSSHLAGVIKIFDCEAGETVSIIRYPTFAKASIEFNKKKI